MWNTPKRLRKNISENILLLWISNFFIVKSSNVHIRYVYCILILIKLALLYAISGKILCHYVKSVDIWGSISKKWVSPSRGHVRSSGPPLAQRSSLWRPANLDFEHIAGQDEQPFCEQLLHSNRTLLKEAVSLVE